jgi:hypothetical protein
MGGNIRQKDRRFNDLPIACNGKEVTKVEEYTVNEECTVNRDTKFWGAIAEYGDHRRTGMYCTVQKARRKNFECFHYNEMINKVIANLI